MFSSELCLHFLEWTRQAEKTAWFSLVPPYLQSLFCRAANFMSVPRLNPAQFLQQRTHESFFPDLATTKDKIREDLFRTARQQSHVGVGMRFSTQSQNAFLHVNDGFHHHLKAFLRNGLQFNSGYFLCEKVYGHAGNGNL